ncbi:MAG: hypothetical protein RR942_15650 [Romboutsia sp.]
MKGNYYSNEYMPSIVKWGKITLLLGIILSFAPIFVVSVIMGYMPPVDAIIAGAAAQIGAFGVLYVVEPISYFPILGVPGTYLSFLAGNIGNMRVPCSITAQESAGVQTGTEKGSVVSTIGISISIIVNIIILTIGIFLGSSILAALPESITNALNLILPALFGAVFGQFAIKDLRLGIIALVIAGIMTSIVRAGLLSFLPGNPVYMIIIVSVFGTIMIGKKLIAIDEARESNKK